jgi:hypothetical protein
MTRYPSQRDKAALPTVQPLPTPHWFAQPYVRPLPAPAPNAPGKSAKVKSKPAGGLAANLPPAEQASGIAECVECTADDVAEIEEAEAEVALDSYPISGTLSYILSLSPDSLGAQAGNELLLL